MTGLDNPVFTEHSGSGSDIDTRYSGIQHKDNTDCGSHDSSNSINRNTLPRPQSLNLSSVNSGHEFLLRDDFYTSQNSLDHNRSLYNHRLSNSATVTNEVGSSLSMDSGNPLGTQSLESLNDRSHNTPPSNASSDRACSSSVRVSRYVAVKLYYTETKSTQPVNRQKKQQQQTRQCGCHHVSAVLIDWKAIQFKSSVRKTWNCS